MKKIYFSILFIIASTIILTGCSSNSLSKNNAKKEPLEFKEEYYKRNIKSSDNCYYIDLNNTLWGYGYNFQNQLGDCDREKIYIPSEGYKDEIRKNNISDYEIRTIKIADNVKHISYSGFGSLVYITEDNKLYGLGAGYAGNLMSPTLLYPDELYGDLIKQPKLLLEDVLYAEITGFNTIALKTDGSVWVWGGNLYGEYGTVQGTDYSLEPIKIMDDAVLVAGSGNNFAVLKHDGSLWAWGNNVHGVVDGRNEGKELIEPEEKYCKEPQKVMDNVENVWFGNIDRNYIDYESIYPIYVQKTDGTIYFWGSEWGHNIQEYDINEDMAS